MNEENEDIIPFAMETLDYDEVKAQERRAQYMCQTLSYMQKMELYDFSANGNMNKLIDCITHKYYPILSECSKLNSFWNIFHYASHFGHIPILKFLIHYFQSHPNKFDIFNLQTFDGYIYIYIYLYIGKHHYFAQLDPEI